MREHAGDERVRLAGQSIGRRRVVEAVALTGLVPQREVDVTAVAGVLRPRLRRERCDETVSRRNAPERFADEQLFVRCAQRRCVLRRDLVLAVAELRVVLLEHDPLRLECRDEVVEVLLRRRRADRGEAEPRIDRHVGSVHVDGERELVLERNLEPRASLGEAPLHPLQERPLADRRRLAVERHHVDDHPAQVRSVRQHAKRVRIGHEAYFADRSHPLDGLQLVERAHRLHRDGEPDAALDAPCEPVQRARLRAHRAVVAAPEEADEAETRLVRLLHYFTALQLPRRRQSRPRGFAPVDVLADRIDQHGRGDRDAAQDREPDPPVRHAEERRPLRAERDVRAERGGEHPEDAACV